MAFEKCAAEIAEHVGRELLPKERDEIGEKVLNIVRKLEKRKSGADLTREVEAAVKNLVDEEKINAILTKRNAAKNAEAQVLMADQIFHKWGDAPVEGLRAEFESSRVGRGGSRRGVSYEMSALENEYKQGMFARLAKDDVVDVAASGTMDKEIWRAMYEMGKNVPDEKVLSSLPPDAVKAAKIFAEFNERARVAANEAGANIPKAHSYVIKQSHDNMKIAKAAGPDVPLRDKAHRIAWQKDIRESLDFDRTFPDVPEEKVDKILDDLFKEFSEGYHLTFGKKGTGPAMGTGNIGKKMSHERVLHFKDADAEFAYHQKYGQSDRIIEGMMSGLQKSARDTALMNKFGPNAEMNIASAVEDLKHRFHDTDKAHLIPEIEKEHRRLMEQFWPQLTGEANIPGSNVGAKISQIVRATHSMGKLGLAVLNAAGDIPYYASTLNYTGPRSTKGFYGFVLEGMEKTFGNLGRKFSPADMELAASWGIQIDHMMGHLNSAMAADLDMPGRASRALETFFRYNGLTRWQDAERFAVVSSTANRHAKMAVKSFDDLEIGYREFFKQHDIDAHDWDVIRSGEKVLDNEGREFLTPENILKVSDETAGAALKAKGKRATPTAIDQYRKNLKTSYSRLFSDIAHMGTSEPSKMNRSFMLRGSKPGTLGGESLRFLWQFKSFSLSVMQKHLGRELYGHTTENISFPRAMSDLVTGKNKQGLASLANMMATGTAFGYLSMSLKQIAKGKTPRVPDDGKEAAKIAGAAMLQSGALGIYGDFLFGETNRNGQNQLTTALGPTFGTGMDVVNMYNEFKAGEPKAAKVFDFALNNTPGVNAGYNLFYTRAALDYLFVYRMKEMMNPGYLKRMEKQLKNNTDQEYILPPSSVIPRGGGF